ncbi:ABC transporter permease [Compostibacter hankyongensis]|uniref:ABC transporter permease n=1 Tax=Compostibacter hankyongensis TaxID=1007089 RepID=A0ABP8G1I0_9BACT
MAATAQLTAFFKKRYTAREGKSMHPFRVMVFKEVSDHVRSWRFIILGALMVLTCMGALYTSITNLSAAAAKPDDPDSAFFFLKLFTVSDGTLPPFFVFITFLGPLIGISLGFDAINAEQNGRTLSRIMAQPIHRDYLINAKFTAALIIISVMFFALTLLVIGCGLLMIGIPPSPEEFLRILSFLALSILYVAFWLSLSILFSVRFRQAATSALTAIAVWLFFSVFYQIIINLLAKSFIPPEGMAPPEQIIRSQKLVLGLSRLMPGQLFSDATTTLLRPSVRSLGPLTMTQVYGAIPSPLPLGQSLLLVWPQLTGLIAATALCFAISYVLFMRREIRSR